MSALPGWNTVMGLQFENLILSNRSFIHKKLGINPNDIISENPFYQNKTARAKGCQIDYLIQTRFNTLYVIEIKYYRGTIGLDITHQVQEKIDRLKKPKTFSCRPVLVYVGELSFELTNAEYFDAVIDFKEILLG